jgi:hypothetical protein
LKNSIWIYEENSLPYTGLLEDPLSANFSNHGKDSAF